MEDRFAPRLQEMLDSAVCHPEVTAGTLTRLQEFLRPFAQNLTGPAQRTHTAEYVQGLFSKLERKTGEAIAYLHDQERQGLQKFIGQVPWDHRPLLRTLATQVGEQIGEADGVIVFDPSGFAKKGPMSVGVARQWCGRLGKVENCQVGVFMGYVTCQGHALVDMRLYLPKEWAKDRKRCAEAGIPTGTRFRTRHELALAMLDEQGSVLPHGWVAGDDEMGRPAEFRRELRARGERYLLAVPSNTQIRDLEADPPAYAGRGRPAERPFVQVRRWCAAVPAGGWVRLDVRDGTKGPLVVEAVQCRVAARLGKGVGPAERLFITRELQSDGSYKHDFYLGHTGPTGVSLMELARVAKAEHRIEECLQRGKSEAGLGDYQVRNWVGWHHHLTLSLVAAWFLVGEARRGKNLHTGPDGPTALRTDRESVGRPSPVQPASERSPTHDPLVAAQRAGPILSLPRT
jgi:SRSO17 transposase